MSTHGQNLRQIIEDFAPRRFAMEGDKVGLQVGTLEKPVARVLTTLDVTPDVVAEAMAKNIDLIVSHHAVVFRPLKDMRTDHPKGQLISQLIKNDIAVYVPHTAMDITNGGINDHLAQMFELSDVKFLKETGRDEASLRLDLVEGQVQFECEASRKLRAATISSDEQRAEGPWQVKLESHALPRGIGRVGRLKAPTTLGDFAQTVMKTLDIGFLRRIGPAAQKVEKVALLCGDGNRFVQNAHRLGADVLITGDVYYHTALEARALGIGLLDPGHNATERVVRGLWKRILEAGLAARKIDGVDIQASEVNTEPFEFEVRRD